MSLASCRPWVEGCSGPSWAETLHPRRTGSFPSLAGFCPRQDGWMLNPCMNIDVFTPYFLFCLHAECDSVNKCIYGCIHAAVERVPIFWCVTSPAAQIWCTRKAQRCMETHLFPVLICMCGAKLDPEAFKSASVSMTVHKSYIINLRKCHEFLHPWRLGC